MSDVTGITYRALALADTTRTPDLPPQPERRAGRAASPSGGSGALSVMVALGQ